VSPDSRQVALLGRGHVAVWGRCTLAETVAQRLMQTVGCYKAVRYAVIATDNPHQVGDVFIGVRRLSSGNIDERQAFKFRELVAVISSISQLNYGR
jgi:hypothetical protein